MLADGSVPVFQLMHKLSVEAPPKILVERYLIEIAKNYNVPYEPDSVVMVSGAELETSELASSPASSLTAKPSPSFLWHCHELCSSPHPGLL